MSLADNSDRKKFCWSTQLQQPTKFLSGELICRADLSVQFVGRQISYREQYLSK